ncbi:aliphatic sulfonate ABC transporter substrate-binding protein [Bordetella genomosp. 12]|uniref:Taurine ABC transporter substrate-binding protein n=1 Tax=Bordetella genomosp. 12 TaxID=463035 RepID=A0A261VN87_9BORD|nr:aliphatic sulfonate ABC transporter substrate-binding protein [Bordetella genomosp. 12]OZI75221.1 taurine ABC transporter substrate-binding protein [Bordetella genomosp. 12]
MLKRATALAAASTMGFPMIARAAKTRLTYGGSGWLGHYSAYIALKTGLFDKQGLDIAWQSFATSSDRMGAVMAGNIDLAGTGVVSSLALMAAGARQFQVIATPNNFGRAEGVLVREDVKDVAGLKGKKIGVTYASSAHVLLLDVLQQAGLDPEKDVTIINLPATNLLAAFQGKQIEAAVAWTPAFDRIKAIPGTRVLLDDTAFSLYKQFGITPGPDVLLTRASVGKENPEAVHKFLTAVFQANTMMTESPAEAAKVLLELTGLTQQEQEAVIKQTTWYTEKEQHALMVDPGNFVNGMQQLAGMLVSLKQIDKAPVVKDWVQTKYL